MSSKKYVQPIFYTYVYLNPLKPGVFTYNNFVTFFYEPFYIGKGHGKRYNDHINEKHSSNKHKFNTIQKIKKSNLTPIIIKIIDKVDALTALQIEINLIEYIGRASLSIGPLTNMTDGGDGRLGVNHKGNNNPMYGKKHSSTTIKKLSDNQKGKKASTETKRKQSIAHSGHSRGNSGAITKESNKKRSDTLLTLYQTIEGKQIFKKIIESRVSNYWGTTQPNIIKNKNTVISYLSTDKFIKGKTNSYYYPKNTYPNIRFQIQNTTLKCLLRIGSNKWKKLWIAKFNNIINNNDKLYILKTYGKSDINVSKEYSEYFILVS